MKNSIEWLAEEYFLQVFTASNALVGIAMRHHDDQQDAEENSIVIEGIQEEKQLEGPNGYRVSVEIEYRSKLNEAKERTDNIANSIRSAVQSPSPVSMLSQLSDLYILDEDITGSRNDSKQLRKRQFTVPVIINPKNS